MEQPVNERIARRKGAIFGLIADKQSQLKWAFTLSVSVVLPASVLAIATLTRLILGVSAMRDRGDSSGEISKFVLEYCITASLVLTCLYSILGGVAFLLALRTSSQVIGPVKRLEDQIERLVNGQPGGNTVLRQGDYLMRLSGLINSLSRRLDAPSQESTEGAEPAAADPGSRSA